jgi:hypothetical protein
MGKYAVFSESNSKLNKEKSIYTIGLMLSPAKSSGFNVCSHSGNCEKACIGEFAGFNRLKSVQNKHIETTREFFADPKTFLNVMLFDILKAERYAEKQGKKLAVRLNVFSDIPWEKMLFTCGRNLFEILADNGKKTVLYDYTKNPRRFYLNSAYPNYHITASYSENWELSKNATLKLLSDGVNIAIPFIGKIPRNYSLYFKGENGYINAGVKNGDNSDYRPNDKKGIFIGLKAKGGKNITENNPFFITVK